MMWFGLHSIGRSINYTNDRCKMTFARFLYTSLRFGFVIQIKLRRHSGSKFILESNTVEKQNRAQCTSTGYGSSYMKVRVESLRFNNINNCAP